VTSEDAAMVRALEHLLNAPLEHRTLQDFDYTMSAPNSEYIRPPRQIRRPTTRYARIGNKKVTAT
jgi:hypothetical protein